MLTEINVVVQALVWTTLAGMMYAVWLHIRADANGEPFDLSHHWQPVLRLLQALWVFLAIGLIISIFIAAIPGLFETAASASPTCAPSAAVLTVASVDNSTLLACGPHDNSTP